MPELRAAVASIGEEQKDNALVFLECNMEELDGLPNKFGVQAVANTCTLLDNLPTASLTTIFFTMCKSKIAERKPFGFITQRVMAEYGLLEGSLKSAF